MSYRKDRNELNYFEAFFRLSDSGINKGGRYLTSSANAIEEEQKKWNCLFANRRQQKRQRRRQWERKRQGSGCGSVGRAVASDTRGPLSPENFILPIYSQLYLIDKNKKKKKEAGFGPNENINDDFNDDRADADEREQFSENVVPEIRWLW